MKQEFVVFGIYTFILPFCGSFVTCILLISMLFIVASFSYFSFFFISKYTPLFCTISFSKRRNLNANSNKRKNKNIYSSHSINNINISFFFISKYTPLFCTISFSNKSFDIGLSELTTILPIGNSLTYKGASKSDTTTLEINNQGGIIGIAFGNTKLGTYNIMSEEAPSIFYFSLLKIYLLVSVISKLDLPLCVISDGGKSNFMFVLYFFPFVLITKSKFTANFMKSIYTKYNRK